MSEPKAAADMEYRLPIPTFEELQDRLGEGHKTSRAYADIIDRVDSMGRKRTVKTELFESLMEDDATWCEIDLYVLFRMFTDRFPHPQRAPGLADHLIEEAVAEAFDFNEEYVKNHANRVGNVSRWLKEEGIGGDGSADPTGVEMYETLDYLEGVGSESEIRNTVRDMIQDMEHPWVFTHLVGRHMAFYVGNYMMLDAAAARDHRATESVETELKEAWKVKDDAPLVFADWADDPMSVETELTPHSYHAIMKAKNDYEPSDVPDLQESGDWVAQTKYDGARIFIHHSGDGDYRAYMNGGRDITGVLPELFEEPLASLLPDHSFIFDGEATPYDTESGDVLPFQHILRRTSRSPGEMMDGSETEDMEVRFKFFDCPFWMGDDIRERKYKDRFACVQTSLIPPFIAQTGDDLEASFHRSLDEGHEGLVMKKKGHEYQLNNRSSDWQKWKAQPETLDVAVMDANRGGGRISDGIGALEIGVKHDGELVQVGSVGTGFTDEERRDLLREWETGSLKGQVIEVSFEELQAGSGDSDDADSAWALRFPSYNHKRPDGEVDTLERAADLDGKSEMFESWVDSR